MEKLKRTQKSKRLGRGQTLPKHHGAAGEKGSLGLWAVAEENSQKRGF